MARVGRQAQAIRDPGPTNDVPVRVLPPRISHAAEPHATVSSDKVSAPGVTVEYAAVWLDDLASLSRESGQSFATRRSWRLHLNSGLSTGGGSKRPPMFSLSMVYRTATYAAK